MKIIYSMHKQESVQIIGYGDLGTYIEYNDGSTDFVDPAELHGCWERDE